MGKVGKTDAKADSRSAGPTLDQRCSASTRIDDESKCKVKYQRWCSFSSNSASVRVHSCSLNNWLQAFSHTAEGWWGCCSLQPHSTPSELISSTTSVFSWSLVDFLLEFSDNQSTSIQKLSTVMEKSVADMSKLNIDDHDTSDRKLLVAVDFGTTYSGVAWAQTRRPDVQTIIIQWPDTADGGLEGVSSDKVPT